MTFIAKRHLCAESTRATSRMMVLACIVAFPETKLRGYNTYIERETYIFYIATFRKYQKASFVNKKAIYIFIKKFSFFLSNILVFSNYERKSFQRNRKRVGNENLICKFNILISCFRVFSTRVVSVSKYLNYKQPGSKVIHTI